MSRRKQQTSPGKRMAVLRRLEAMLCRPSFGAPYPEKTFSLVWRHFIKGSPSGFAQSEPVFVKAITPRDPVVLAVQLRGSYAPSDSFRTARSFDWFAGRYTLHLHGVIDKRRLRLSPRSGFTFELNDVTSGQLSPTEFDAPFTRSVRLTD